MTTGVLLMAYGTPATTEDIEAYYTHIRHGHPPTHELLEELTGRYEAIGGLSPLLDISRRQAEALHESLGLPVVLGMKHAAPFIEDAVDRLASQGVDEIVGLALAPHYSSMSVGQYEERVRARLASIADAPRFTMIKNWHMTPSYLSLLTRRLEEALRLIPEDRLHRTEVIFSAHSLPESILRKGDPYPRQLGETAKAVSLLARWPSWSTAWQSAGRTDAKWLGPDILDVLRDLAGGGTQAVVISTCGFVTDHLEVLYDVDIEAAALAEELGLTLVRTRSPNADPMLIDALTDVVRRELERMSGIDACGCNGHCRALDSIETLVNQGGK